MSVPDLGSLVTFNVKRPGRWYTLRMSKEKYDALAEEARALLSEENNGYLAPWELMECSGFLEKTCSLETTDFLRANARIARLKNAGIPPLYENTGSVVPSSCFPVVDFMIQFPTGKLLKRWAGQQHQNRMNPRKSFTPRIYPSSLDDILDFRTLAFDGDRLSPQVIREFIDYTSEKETGEVNNKTVTQADLLRLKYLELALSGIPPSERTYQSPTPGDFSFIGSRFWHTQYTPEDRAKIAEEYVKCLQDGALRYNSKKNRHGRMRALFPEIVNIGKEDLKRIRNERTMEACRQEGDYTRMPSEVLLDGFYGSKYLEDLKGHVRGNLEQLMKEKGAFEAYGRLEDLHADLKMPNGALYLTEFRDIITAERLRVLNEMSDENFVALFGNKGRFMSIGHRKEGSWKESLVDQQFRSALIQRYRSLVGN